VGGEAVVRLLASCLQTPEERGMKSHVSLPTDFHVGVRHKHIACIAHAMQACLS